MTTTTIHHPQISTKTVGLAFAGALLAAGVGYGVAALVLDDATLIAPSTSIDDNAGAGNPGMGFSDANGFAGTDREVRSFQHRR